MRTVANGCCPSAVTTCGSPPRCVKAKLPPVWLLLLPLPPRESTAVSEATAEVCAAEDPPLPVVGVGTGDGSDATAVPAVAASDAMAAPIETSARDALVPTPPPPASVLVSTAWLPEAGEGASGAASTSGGSAANGNCERSNDAAESAAVDAIPAVAPGRPESSDSDGCLGMPAASTAAAVDAGGGLGCRRGRRLKPESTSALPSRPPASSSPSL